MVARLNVNIDHIATVRQARRAPEPSVVAAALLAEQAGADGITVHLRSDRRHIQDHDLYALRQTVTIYLNVEMAATEEMIAIALDTAPDAVTLVAENPNEITTEGGMDVRAGFDTVRAAVDRLRDGGRLVSLFIDPDAEQIEGAREAGADQIELCTALYADATRASLPGRAGKSTQVEREQRAERELKRLREAAMLATQSGLRVAAGHGLTYRNVGPVAGIKEIKEFNIGHNIIARAIFAGLERAILEMREAIKSD